MSDPCRYTNADHQLNYGEEGAMVSDIMQQLGFSKKPDPEEEVVDVVPADAPVTYSRDIIIRAIQDVELIAHTTEEFADHIIKALADKHLHIFKSKGSEL